MVVQVCPILTMLLLGAWSTWLSETTKTRLMNNQKHNIQDWGLTI